MSLSGDTVESLLARASRNDQQKSTMAAPVRRHVGAGCTMRIWPLTSAYGELVADAVATSATILSMGFIRV
jgi:hypothetical protein